MSYTKKMKKQGPWTTKQIQLIRWEANQVDVPHDKNNMKAPAQFDNLKSCYQQGNKIEQVLSKQQDIEDKVRAKTYTQKGIHSAQQGISNRR